MDSKQVTVLNQQIADGDASVLKLLAELSSRCIDDEEALTPFAAAIRSGNEAVTSLLAADPDAREYHPEFDSAIATQIRMMLSGSLHGTVDNTEEHLREHHYVEDQNWARTPLLEACRFGNAPAIRLLVASGADLAAKDALGQRALDYCLEERTDDLALVLLRSCAETDRTYPVDEEQLEASIRRPEIYDLLLETGKLNAKARHLVFNLACAKLDRETVEEMIAAKYKPQSAVSYHHHPVFEVATSRAVWVHGLPEFAELAPGFAHMYGHPDSLQGLNSEKLFDDNGQKISMAQAMRLNQEKNEAVKWQDRDPLFVPDEQLRKRMEFLDYLSQFKLKPGKYGENPISELTATNRPELLDRISDFGFDTSNVNKDDARLATVYNCLTFAKALRARLAGKPAAAELPEAIWELPMESGLKARFMAMPTSDAPNVLELEIDNVYGPVDGIELFVRKGDVDHATPHDAYASFNDWQRPLKVSETILIDDDELPRDEVEEPILDEAPWVACFNIEVDLQEGDNRVEIAVVSAEVAALNGVFSDWLVTVA